MIPYQDFLEDVAWELKRVLLAEKEVKETDLIKVKVYIDTISEQCNFQASINGWISARFCLSISEVTFMAALTLTELLVKGLYYEIVNVTVFEEAKIDLKAYYEKENNEMFDEQAFMRTMYNEPTSTEFLNVPEGSDWIGISKKLGFKTIKFKDKETGEQVTKQIMVITWEVDDPRLEAQISQRKATVRQEFWLDLKPDGGLDMSPGKNTQLGRARETLGQNTPGQPWAPIMMVGHSAKLDVTHRVDPDDGKIYASVKAIAPIA